MKRILITGAQSYIGTSIEKYLNQPQFSGMYQVETLDMQNLDWKKTDFSRFDSVFHVAGIAHADVGKVSEDRKKFYYKINTELAVETAEKAKKEGVKQFIFMSSMIIYSGCKETLITKKTKPKPLNFYGDSKWKADHKIRKMEDESFKVVVLRPPMIYGKESKGNYLELSRLAGKLPVFPYVKNQRSMLYIGNLCRFVQLIIDNNERGIFFPQNREYTVTSDMVRLIARAKHHHIFLVHGFGWMVKLMMKLPGKLGGMAGKAFGDLSYEMSMSEYREDYRIYNLSESIRCIETK